VSAKTRNHMAMARPISAAEQSLRRIAPGRIFSMKELSRRTIRTHALQRSGCMPNPSQRSHRDKFTDKTAIEVHPKAKADDERACYRPNSFKPDLL
jgi:hypothetical protein